MRMKEIKIPISDHAELLIHVTDQMMIDYRACAVCAGATEEDGKDCETCSWWGQDIGDEGICQLLELEKLLED